MNQYALACRVVDVLNRAYLIDPDAIAALIETRVPCTRELAESEGIVVLGTPEGDQLGPLGLLNSIVGVCPGTGMGYVAAEYQVVCPDHGRTKKDTPVRVGAPCQVDGCDKQLVLGQLERFIVLAPKDVAVDATDRLLDLTRQLLHGEAYTSTFEEYVYDGYRTIQMTVCEVTDGEEKDKS